MSLPASPNFRSRAESIDAMDILDELMTSFDDTLSASSPQHHDGDQQHSLQNSPNHNDMHDNDDMTWRLTNSVHMVLQENARLPTFVENVDRTGSSFRKLHYLHEPQQQQDGSVNTNDYKPENLGETFLGSSNRHAYHGSYANAGALTRGTFTTAATTTRNYNTIGQDAQAAAAAASFAAINGNRETATASTNSIRKDMTNQPRLRGDSMEQLFDYQMMDYVASIQDEKKDTTALYDNDEQLLDALSVDPTPLEEIKRTTMLQRHSGQHRQQALPIPVNGARDINFMRGSIVNDSGGMASPELSLQQHSDHAGRSGSFAATDAQRQASTNSAANHQASASKSIPASIERASQQKSQYGFGRKHKVPSIPEPLSHVPKATTGGGSVKNKRSATHDDGDDPDDSGSNANNVNAGDAYERKKHRAKVARVKLNESIEQLSIAIHVAGSQSKERADQWQTVVKPSSSFITSSVPTCLTEATLTAEQAKKWDRPTFVRSAAKMVEYLNTQCDLLMRELVSTKNELKNGDHKRKADENGAVYTEEMEAKRCRVDQVLHHNQQGLAIDITIRNGMDLILGSSSRVNSCIASFLDPKTIVRCTQVSKTFKRHFDGSVAWNDMAIQRFGFFNVRQWREKLEDADEGISCLPLRLYKCMDAENVMPHFNHDGMFLLGEARLQGVVSAWTFLVERSNGETLRSCKRSDGQDTFTSLPVVELRTVVQNTGRHDYPIIIREQLQSVDASTRRRGVEMKEISWDERFSKRIVNLDGSVHFSSSRPRPAVGNVICQLGLFESAVIQTHIHAQGCSTISKFVQRSNFTKFLVQIRHGTTVPLVIPFPRDHSHTLEH
ncbi:hypothetical protein MPSEU_000306700 [Mayamaea pseudoterrestris]|nr:hypothetical protein MPSEU_000306700 [Mayamaea pseudoterrestris]